MLGCLFGYVSGGILGRVLDKALGVVERRVDRRSPARFVAGTLGAIAGSTLALVLVLPAALLVPVPVAVSLVGLASWIFGYVGYRVVARQSEAVLELLGLSTRPLVRAQAFDARDGLLVDSSVVMDGQLLPLTRGGVLSGDLMVARFVLDEVQGFADATDDVKRRRARRGLETLDALRKEATSASSCSTTRCPSSTRSTPSSSRWRGGCSSGCSRTTARSRATPSCRACRRPTCASSRRSSLRASAPATSCGSR